MSEYERRLAIREAEANTAEDAYFSARPELDTKEARRLFSHAFARGWDRRTDSKLMPHGERNG